MLLKLLLFEDLVRMLKKKIACLIRFFGQIYKKSFEPKNKDRKEKEEKNEKIQKLLKPILLVLTVTP